MINRHQQDRQADAKPESVRTRAAANEVQVESWAAGRWSIVEVPPKKNKDQPRQAAEMIACSRIARPQDQRIASRPKAP